MKKFGHIKIEKLGGYNFMQLHPSRLALFGDFVLKLIDSEEFDEEFVDYNQLRKWWKKKLINVVFESHHERNEFFIINGLEVMYIQEKEILGFAEDGFLLEAYEYAKSMRT